MLIKSDNEYHLLRLPSYLEYSHRLEMGLLYPLRGGVWIKWPSHGVSPLFTLFTRKGKERRRKLTVKQLGSWNLLRRQRRTSPGYRQHEWNGVCLPGLVAAGCLATGGCAAVSEGVYYCEYYVGDFDYYHCYYKGVGEGKGGGFEIVLMYSVDCQRYTICNVQYIMAEGYQTWPKPVGTTPASHHWLPRSNATSSPDDLPEHLQPATVSVPKGE